MAGKTEVIIPNDAQIGVRALVLILAMAAVVYGWFRRANRRMERALRASRTKENLVMRVLPIVHYSAEGSGEYDALWVSDNVRQVSGFSGSTFLKEPGLWVARLHPDDRERVLQEFQLIHERGMVSVEYRWQVADGTYHWLLDRAVLQPSSNGRSNEIAGFWLDITDITERQPGPLKAEREDLERRVAERTADLSEANERLRVLSRRLMETQEMERRAIARDLHDEIGQALTAIKLNLRELREVAGNAPIETHVTDSLEILDQVLRHTRSLALDLRPSLLDELGLVPALRWYAGKQADRAGWTLQFHAGEIGSRPSPEVEIACFRLAQEALTNAARHAQAKYVDVRIERTGRGLLLTIRDDGIGFDVQSTRAGACIGTSVGLSGMEERIHLVGGRITIESAQGKGTEIRATFA